MMAVFNCGDKFDRRLNSKLEIHIDQYMEIM